MSRAQQGRTRRCHVRHRRRCPHSHGQASGLPQGPLRRRSRGDCDQGRSRTLGSDTGPGRLRDHGPGAAGRHRSDHRAPGRSQGRHRYGGACAHHQQGVPVGPRCHRARRSTHPRWRIRHRRGRRHGVDDQCPTPAHGLARGSEVRRLVGHRLHGLRRTDLRLRRVRDGRVDRALQRALRPDPRGAGCLRREITSPGGGRAGGRCLRRGDRRRGDPPAQG